MNNINFDVGNHLYTLGLTGLLLHYLLPFVFALILVILIFGGLYFLSKQIIPEQTEQTKKWWIVIACVILILVAISIVH
jgi:hypothetical protein